MIVHLLGSDLPGREHARELAHHELGRSPYQQAKPSWFMRLIHYVLSRLNEGLSSASGSFPGGGLGLVVLGLVLAGLVAVVVVRLRPSRTGTATRQELFGDTLLRADEHRERADRAATAGQYDVAVRERLRAVVRELESRGVLDPRAGRTADEVAREAGAAVPAVAEPLQRGATVFDEVWYGGRAADAASYQVLIEVDRVVTGTRLVGA